MDATTVNRWFENARMDDAHKVPELRRRFVPLPAEGRILEPVIGRQNPASPVVPARIAASLKDGQTLDGSRKNFRVDPLEFWDREHLPAPEPQRQHTLKVLVEHAGSVRVRLREDLDKEVLKRVKKEGYTARWGKKRKNRFTRVCEPALRLEAEVGQVYSLPVEDAIYLLRDRTHGMYFEEVPIGAPGEN